jgi:solute carrier family 41
LFFYTSGRSQNLQATIPQNTTTAIQPRFFQDPASIPAPTPAFFPLLPFLTIVVLLLSVPFVFKLCSQLTFSRPLIRDGWTPLLVAMAIESGTGLVLDWFVGRYRGFGLLAVVMTGLPGSVGAVFVSRLGTELHQSESKPNQSLNNTNGSPRLVSLTLFAVGLPVLLSYLLFVWGAGWLPLPFGFVALFVAVFAITVSRRKQPTG